MGQVYAEKRIDFALVRQADRQCWRVFGCGQGRLNVGVVRLNMQGKAQIGGGIFVGWIKQRFFGQLVESVKTVVKLLDCAGKYAAATGGEQGIAAENVKAV